MHQSWPPRSSEVEGKPVLLRPHQTDLMIIAPKGENSDEIPDISDPPLSPTQVSRRDQMKRAGIAVDDSPLWKRKRREGGNEGREVASR